MARQNINIGSAPNDGTGDPLRTAFGKVNDNFTELYSGAFSGNYVDLTNKPENLLAQRATVIATTASIADGASSTVDLLGYKAYAILSIETDRAAWVRVYSDATSRSNDASRVQSVDPSPNAGVIAEVITTGAETIKLTPAALGFNAESTPTTVIPLRITNLSGSSAQVTATFTLLQLER